MSLKLNIGAGDVVIDGFTPIDRKFGKDAYPLDYPDGAVDEIRAVHILEHFSFDDVRRVLDDWSRKLRVGGRIRISVPDMDWLSKHASDPLAPYYLMGGQTDENDFHRSAFNEATLREGMERAGITGIRRWESSNTDCASMQVSLNLEGVKGGDPVSAMSTLKVAAMVSIPRLGWNDHWGCVFDALHKLKIPIRRMQGVFWGQCMQRGLEDCIADGVDWALVMDYDTMFTEKHVDTLLGSMGNDPNIDALAPIQLRRGKPFPLLTRKGPLEMETEGVPVQVATAHFGLTLIRLDSLKKVPKPWFKGVPDDNGEWGDDRLDEDIWFWHIWKKAGNTVYVDPTVKVGHLELMVGDFDDDLNPRHRYVSDWYKEHKPQKDRSCKSDS